MISNHSILIILDIITIYELKFANRRKDNHLEHIAIHHAIIDEDYVDDKKTMNLDSFAAIAFAGYSDALLDELRKPSNVYRKLITIQVFSY